MSHLRLVGGLIRGQARSNSDGGTGGLAAASRGLVTACACEVLVNGTYHVGGLVGDNYDSSSISASFWDKSTSGRTTSDGGTGLTTSQMKTKTIFLNAGWDFVNTWCMPLNSYPRLKWEGVPCGIGQ